MMPRDPEVYLLKNLI